MCVKKNEAQGPTTIGDLSKSNCSNSSKLAFRKTGYMPVFFFNVSNLSALFMAS